jgi:hypothetical protein
MGRAQLDVYGPVETEEMTEHVLAAWHRDVEIRTNGQEKRSPQSIHGHDVQPGVVYRNDKVTVTAFPVPHGGWPQAFGNCFDTPKGGFRADSRLWLFEHFLGGDSDS